MEITQKMIEYKTDNHRIQVDRLGDKVDITVFDLNNNIILSLDSIKQAEDVAHDLLKVLEQLKI